MAKKDDGAIAPVIVVGLGRFGVAVGRSLVRLGHEVLAVDENVDIVQRLASDFTHVVAADTTDTEALRQIGADQFDRAVVGIGTDIEASVLTVLSLVELGVTEVWAKAVNAKHARILEKVGAAHVVLPESAIARTRAPEGVCGKTLLESGLRARFGVTVVGVKKRGEDFTYARPETFVDDSFELIVSGPTVKVEAFCALH